MRLLLLMAAVCVAFAAPPSPFVSTDVPPSSPQQQQPPQPRPTSPPPPPPPDSTRGLQCGEVRMCLSDWLRLGAVAFEFGVFVAVEVVAMLYVVDGLAGQF